MNPFNWVLFVPFTVSKTFTVYYYYLYAFDFADLIIEEENWPRAANVFPFYTVIYG